MDFLKSLGIENHNSGASTGSEWWSNTDNAGTIASINPTNGEMIAQVHNASEADYQQVIAKAQEAAKIWRTVPAPERGEVVRQMGLALREHKDALGSLVSLEMGKIKQEGDGEVQEMIDIADFAVGQSRMLYGKTMHSERPLHRMYEQWHPLGVVGIISAFNFPVAVWAWNALIAAIAGNASVWKPSQKTPLTAIAVQNICNQVMKANDLPGIFSFFVSDDRKLAEQFVDDERVALISFTGSTQVGRHVGERVAKRMGKFLLELGGNNALIIDETADLSLAIPATAFGAVGTAGQRCTTTRRLFVQDSIYDDVCQRLINAYKQVKIGDPLVEGTLMGPLIDETSVQTFLNAIESAKQQGGEVLFGGSTVSGSGYFVQPTLIAANNEWEIVKHETFGPILYVMRFSDIDDAIAQQNAVRQGLSSALFTTNLSHAEKFLSSVGSDCGIANVNIGTSGAEIGGAFGGEKETGGGREAGSDSWQAYMRRQTNTINWGSSLPLAQGIKFDL